MIRVVFQIGGYSEPQQATEVVLPFAPVAGQYVKVHGWARYQVEEVEWCITGTQSHLVVTLR